ncbi:CehA/McbA family metallohydrolase [Prosthecobacter sp. SYSU 5D2]|uniref:CehA/McbA family metallohydrolase n=1 Tax=Prosthecobacter sp. SYSU 5D2 TaxID=3134134 RepID=UPI0031FEA180
MKTIALFLLATSSALWSAEVFEANQGREKELPGGKEADGIRGDFVLRNDKVEAVISHNGPNRRANMSTFYGADGASPGSLYDLTLRGASNDQLVAYCPGGHGPVSYVRILTDQPKGEAAIESVTTAASNGGIYKRNEYRVKDGQQGLIITTTWRNETDAVQKVPSKSDLTRFNSTGETVEGIYWADAINPAHKCGYALATLEVTGADKVSGDIQISPGASVSIRRFFAVGTSPAQAVGEALEAKGKNVSQVAGSLQSGGAPVTTATVHVPFTSKPVPAYPDEKGVYQFKMPTGKVELKVTDLGRADTVVEVHVGKAGAEAPETPLPAAARIRFEIADEGGVSFPCKAHFEPLDKDAPKLDLGPKERAHGCVDQYHSEKGQFIVQLPPGRYRVVVVRGPEYGHLAEEVTVQPNQESVFKGVLKRLVDTKGWISADFHNHSTPSGDNVCDTDGRLINIAAEHLEFAPTTEHNRLYDWEPVIESLGLSPFIKTVKGMELTGAGQHFNAFPFEPDPLLQDGGAPVWNDDPRVSALTLRRWQGEQDNRWIQFNHPNLTDMFVDRDRDDQVDGGFIGVGSMIDGMETQNGASTDILHDAPFKFSRAANSLATKVMLCREFMWRQLLNQGHRLVAVGVADAHTVYGNGVGCWRVYLPSSTDDPAAIDWAELSPKAKAGNMILTTGPFLEVATADGKIAGSDVSSPGGVELKVTVQCTDWQDINRVQVLVNGRLEPTLNFTRESHPQMFQDGVVKFDQTLQVPLKEDAHLIVVAMHETMTLKTGYGTSSYATMRPCAYNNPIYVDVDGGGFKANGDNLGFDPPTMGLTVDQAKALLEKRK